MKQISAKQLALSFTGMFLGAGFVSGQELWQFFACFGPIGLLGFLGTVVIFFYVNYASLRLVQATGQEDMGRMLTWGDHPWLRALVSAMQCLLLFGVSIIMIAGAATLIHQLAGLPLWLGGLLFTTVVVLVAMMGMHGLVATFSLLVPVTTVCALILGVVTLAKGCFQFAPANGSVSALVPNWIIGFLTYAAYNLFGCISVLVPLAKFIPEEKPCGGVSPAAVCCWWCWPGASLPPCLPSLRQVPMISPWRFWPVSFTPYWRPATAC